MLASRLTVLASRVESGENPNPTALLCIRNTRLSEKTRLMYRAEWVSRFIRRRRATESARILDLMETGFVLVVARQGNLANACLKRNRSAGAHLAEQLHRVQPDRVRLSHYCSRRSGHDPELMAVEFFARALDWPVIDGTEDYLAAMYCICRQPDLRFRLTGGAESKLREMASDWIAAIMTPFAPGVI